MSPESSRRCPLTKKPEDSGYEIAIGRPIIPSVIISKEDCPPYMCFEVCNYALTTEWGEGVGGERVPYVICMSA